MSLKLAIVAIAGVILLTFAGLVVRQAPVAEVTQWTPPTYAETPRTDGRPAPFVVTPAPSSETTIPGATTPRSIAQKRLPKIVPPVNPPAPANKPGSPANAKPSKKKPLTVPDARVALALVGADADADEFWRQTINDPLVPAEERSDLIEDLNEVGIDPKNLTLADVPLIESRLELIERMAPDAMDQVNADAFAEAHKDLTNMLKKLSVN